MPFNRVILVVLAVCVSSALAGIVADGPGSLRAGGLPGTPVGGVVTFGDSRKQFNLPPGESVLWAHGCSPSEGKTCILKYMWFGGSFEGMGNTKLRIFVDGEAAPSLEFTLQGIIGSEFEDSWDQTPWNAGGIVGKTGKGSDPGGVWLAFPVPFGKSIEIRAVSTNSSPQLFWCIFRGTQNDIPTMGDYALPPSARLRLNVNHATIEPLGFHTLVNTTADAPTAEGGAVLMVVHKVQSVKNLNFLEGCVYASRGGASGHGSHDDQWRLSSGTEDFYTGTYYFDSGKFQNELAGVLTIDTQNMRFSGYKIHSRDVLFFDNKGFVYEWRNGDYVDSDGSVAGDPQPSDTLTHTLYYVW